MHSGTRYTTTAVIRSNAVTYYMVNRRLNAMRRQVSFPSSSTRSRVINSQNNWNYRKNEANEIRPNASLLNDVKPILLLLWTLESMSENGIC